MREEGEEKAVVMGRISCSGGAVGRGRGASARGRSRAGREDSGARHLISSADYPSKEATKSSDGFLVICNWPQRMRFMEIASYLPLVYMQATERASHTFEISSDHPVQNRLNLLDKV
ncbi:hypothetical protein ACQJBY_012982 [Aegilops geniculata]